LEQRVEQLDNKSESQPYRIEGLSSGRASFDDKATAVVYAMLGFGAKHWLAIVNIFVALYAGLAFLAPYLEAFGSPDLADEIYRLYHYSCHQLPQRSFFIWGEKMAFCERDVAIVLAFLVAGLIFIFMRRQLRPPSMLLYALLCAPMALDGTLQLIGLYESTWELRLFTGTLFGLASGWVVLPYAEKAANSLLRSLGR
jgi:uncharacterized membrane protein